MANKHLKIRIYNGGTVAMGPGKAELLETIDTCGSISSAAKQMQMSYRRAWELVDVMNKCFNQPVVTSASGGQHGGGAHLTDFGRFILKSYRDLVVKAQLATELELNQILSNLNQSE
ncbi:MAG: LysR family transcriptional regulator [Methylotenera sp.]|nr:LysR family transcriptional regulator [Methylotenera sp.]